MLIAGAASLVVGVACGMSWMANQSEHAELRFAGEVLADPAQVRGKRLEVLGYVGCGSIRRGLGTDHQRFEIEDDHVQGSIEARYTGRLPEHFASGTDVVVVGRLSADGSFDVADDGIQMRRPCRLEYRPSPQTRCPTVSSHGGEAF
jgi:cytochrome c-type biogenesis protein CcmE